MRRVIFLIGLMGLIVFGLSACGGGESNSTNANRARVEKAYSRLGQSTWRFTQDQTIKGGRLSAPITNSSNGVFNAKQGIGFGSIAISGIPIGQTITADSLYIRVPSLLGLTSLPANAYLKIPLSSSGLRQVQTAFVNPATQSQLSKQLFIHANKIDSQENVSVNNSTATKFTTTTNTSKVNLNQVNGGLILKAIYPKGVDLKATVFIDSKGNVIQDQIEVPFPHAVTRFANAKLTTTMQYSGFGTKVNVVAPSGKDILPGSGIAALIAAYLGGESPSLAQFTAAIKAAAKQAGF
jgi:hypothetical protein